MCTGNKHWKTFHQQALFTEIFRYISEKWGMILVDGEIIVRDVYTMIHAIIR